MIEKQNIYNLLVKNENPRNLQKLWDELDVFQWPEDQVINLSLSRDDVVSILDRYQHQSLTANEVEDWANFIEAMSYIKSGVGEDIVLDAIYELANPVLEGPLTLQSAQELIKKLNAV